MIPLQADSTEDVTCSAALETIDPASDVKPQKRIANPTTRHHRDVIFERATERGSHNSRRGRDPRTGNDSPRWPLAPAGLLGRSGRRGSHREAANCDDAPYCLDDTEWPGPAEESVAGREGAAHRECQHEESVSALKGVHRHHEGEDSCSIGGQHGLTLRLDTPTRSRKAPIITSPGTQPGAPNGR